MNKKANLILCASGHLPSGAGEAEFESLYNNEIKPLVSALDKFHSINLTFHYSGVVLYWIERRHPELFMLLDELLSRKQIEFLGGGFYNPMLPLLPPADRIGQIEMLTTYLRKHFGRRPQGCWLPASAWEQNLVGALNSCGMSFTFLEDEQFLQAGVKPSEGGIYFPCVTEDQGKLLTVFPVARALGRELRQGKTLVELFEKLSQDSSCPVLVIPVGRDASSQDEKQIPFEKIFEDLSNAGAETEFSSPSRVLKNLRSLKKVYFPGVWTQDQPGKNRIHPRQFIADHSEAGNIYAKMIHVHTLINNQLRGDKTRKHTALEELWKAQDSGIFRLGSAQAPGLCHSPVRKAAYKALLEAEKITREKKKFTPSLSVYDFNLDGEGEYIFQDDKLNCCVKSYGADIFELDYLPAAWNYLDTLSPEDGERRCAFADWLAPPETSPLDAGPEGIKGGCFCGAQEYEVLETDRVHRKLAFILHPREALPWGEIEIEKTWQLKKNSLALEYVLKNSGTENNAFAFCPAIDFSFPGEGEEFIRIQTQREGGKENIVYNEAAVIQNIKVLEFQDIINETVIALEASRSFDGRIFNFRSGLSAQEEYQSTCIMPLFPVSLEAGKTWKASFSLKISS